MPYDSVKSFPSALAGFDPPLSLEQGNAIARCADTAEGESPWSICISSFKKSRIVRDGKWVKKEQEGFGMKTTRQITLRETAKLSQSDESGYLWDVTLIKSGMSRNMRMYATDVLKEAVPLFEGCDTYLDHPTEAQDRERPEREIMDKAGRITGVSESGGSIVGQWAVVDAALRQRMLDAKRVGWSDWAQLSINAIGLGEDVKESDGVVPHFRVDKIEEVLSVDVVTTAAAGGKINRLLASDRSKTDMSEMNWTKVTADEVRANVPNIVTQLKEADQQALSDAEEKITAATARIDALEAELAQAIRDRTAADEALSENRKHVRTLDAEKIVDTTLAESELPESWRKYVKAQLAPAMVAYAGSSEDGQDDVLKASAVKAIADVTVLLGETSQKPKVTGLDGGEVAPVPVDDGDEEKRTAESWASLKGISIEDVKKSAHLM